MLFQAKTSQEIEHTKQSIEDFFNKSAKQRASLVNDECQVENKNGETLHVAQWYVENSISHRTPFDAFLTLLEQTKEISDKVRLPIFGWLVKKHSWEKKLADRRSLNPRYIRNILKTVESLPQIDHSAIFPQTNATPQTSPAIVSTETTTSFYNTLEYDFAPSSPEFFHSLNEHDTFETILGLDPNSTVPSTAPLKRSGSQITTSLHASYTDTASAESNEYYLSRSTDQISNIETSPKRRKIDDGEYTYQPQRLFTPPVSPKKQSGRENTANVENTWLQSPSKILEINSGQTLENSPVKQDRHIGINTTSEAPGSSLRNIIFRL